MRGTVRADIVNTPAGLLTPALYAPDFGLLAGNASC